MSRAQEGSEISMLSLHFFKLQYFDIFWGTANANIASSWHYALAYEPESVQVSC